MDARVRDRDGISRTVTTNTSLSPRKLGSFLAPKIAPDLTPVAFLRQPITLMDRFLADDDAARSHVDAPRKRHGRVRRYFHPIVLNPRAPSPQEAFHV